MLPHAAWTTQISYATERERNASATNVVVVVVVGDAGDEDVRTHSHTSAGTYVD